MTADGITGTVPDVFDPRNYADGIPHDDFEQLRNHDPVSWQEEHGACHWPAGPGFHAVTRYRDAEALWRMDDLRLAGPVQGLVSNFIHGIKHMRIGFTPGRRIR